MGKYRNSCITVKTQCEKKDGLDVTCSEELFLEISVWDLLEDV